MAIILELGIGGCNGLIITQIGVGVELCKGVHQFIFGMAQIGFKQIHSMLQQIQTIPLSLEQRFLPYQFLEDILGFKVHLKESKTDQLS